MLISVQIFVNRGNEKFRTALWVAISRSPARFRPASPAGAGRGTRAAEDLARSKDRRDETFRSLSWQTNSEEEPFFVSVPNFFNERVSQLFFLTFGNKNKLPLRFGSSWRTCLGSENCDGASVVFLKKKPEEQPDNHETVSTLSWGNKLGIVYQVRKEPKEQKTQSLIKQQQTCFQCAAICQNV